MKLRNKNTGEVFNFRIKAEQDYTTSYFTLKTGSGGWEDGLTYGTLEELHEEWEDYAPAEPLIEDEKIRKAVKAWADMNDIRFIHMCSREDKRNARIVGQNAEGRTFTMEINDEYDVRVSFGDYKECYTIAELCGEEEE